MVPNLDAMTTDDLMTFWRKYALGGRTRRVDAQELIGDRRPGYTGLARALANYASNRATAQRCRVRGNIVAALNYEHICQMIYDGLPADLRW